MANNPAVSVIVPMYKVEQYIKLCVDSILAQTFQDFEIIIVDDASPDRCFELCSELYGGNDKVRIIRHEKNLGLGPVRNTGIKNARGKYVYFVDSDDLILPDALENFFTAAEKSNAQVVHAAGRYELVQSADDPVGKGTMTLKWDDYSQEGFLPYDVIYRLNKHWITYATRSNAWLCFCRRDFLEQNQIEFLPIISEDDTFSFALFCFAERYYILHAAFYVHLLRQGAIMRSFDVKRLKQGIEAMVLGGNYVEKIFDKILPRSEQYDAWRESFMTVFFDRFANNHVTPYYKDDDIKPTVNTAAKSTLLPFFGDNESFVRFWLNYCNLFRNRTNSLFKQGQKLLQYNQQLENATALFIREQPALLKLMETVKTDTKKIFLFGTPDHGNLGDHAIALGERHILQNFFPQHEIVEIPRNFLMDELGELLWGLGLEKYIRQSDVIFLIGGGNLGNLWINEEQIRRSLIEKFPDKKIVIFPQSICFTNNDAGHCELATSQKIYNAHKDLHLMTRDENSFNLAKGFFPQINNYLLPDTATALLGITDDVDIERKGVLFVLRGDKEKIRDDATVKRLQEYLTAKNIPFTVTDTVINERVTADNRERKILDMLMKFRAAKVVITDRFHGVVFSFVTRTPVMAFKSFDTKISSGIRWFKNLPSIFYAEGQDFSRMEKFIDEYCFAAAEENSAALTVKVDTDSRERFTRALDKIITANKIYSIESSAPPRLPESVDRRLEGVKRVFTLHAPLSICNFRCHYCYLAQRAEHYQGVQPAMKYSPEEVARALSPKRLGGLAYLNICAEGETLLLKNLDLYVKRLAEIGHYPEIVTNCTITPMLEKILAFDKELLAQIEFKCSFHYLELKKRNMLDRFAENVNKIWDAGASACVEITPSDELIPYIDEVKEFSLKNFGALPQITIARDDRTKGIDILSKLPKDEYYRTWGQFNSPFFDYKTTVFGKRQEEFCYAGIWSAWINLATGQAKACYCGRNLGDVFADPESDFPTWPVGKCSIAYCYNGHAWLTWGDIPQSTEYTYADMRNRVRSDGREWLQPKLKNFFSTHLCDNNAELSDADKLKFMIMNRLGVS